jgi:tetratricopeptide (TPR) repeat protein
MLQRFGECEKNVDAIIANPNSDKEVVGLQVEVNGTAQMQEVPVKAAALNIRATIAIDMKRYTEAEIALNEALKIYPEFGMALQNMERLKSVAQP